MIRIIAVDDHEIFRKGVSKIIGSSRQITLIGEAGSIEETLTLLTLELPDVLVLDINLPGYDDLSGLKAVHRLYPNLPVLILSMCPEERFGQSALNAGAVGYITKAMAAEQLVDAIFQVASGKLYISPSLAHILARQSALPAGDAFRTCDGRL